MKFSIVTPSYNSAAYIADTIESVIFQKGDFDIEYIIQDNRSSDRTLEIVEAYRSMVESGAYPIGCKSIKMIVSSEPDTGMYNAINKGFEKASGDVFAYLNSDDIYLPGALQVVSRCLAARPEVSWLTGITSYIDEESRIRQIGRCYLYNQDLLRNGVYGRFAMFVQQDSVFWRAGLWRRSGGCDSELRMAGDYRLWIDFSRHERLYSVEAYVSCFRVSRNQLSQNMDAYRKEMAVAASGHDGLNRKFRRIQLWKKNLPRIVGHRLSELAVRALSRLTLGRLEYDLLKVNADGSVGAYRGDRKTLNRLISYGARA